MTRSGSTSQADLLVRDIEKEVGLKIIPVDLRAEYVRVCSLVAAKKAELGDADAAQRLAAYKAALGAMYDPN